MEEEITQLKVKMTNLEVKNKAAMEFCSGILAGKAVVVVHSGIGKVNAAICAQILIDEYEVEAIINTGIAGSLKTEINIGDVVLSTDALQHDIDATVFGYDFGVIPRMKVSTFPADEKLIQAAFITCKDVNPEIGVFLGRVVSGDQFIGVKEKKKWIADQFQGYCTEMEGAAIAQAAYLNNIPFLIVRAISDKADDSAQVDYAVFEENAITHTVKLMTALIPKL